MPTQAFKIVFPNTTETQRCWPHIGSHVLFTAVAQLTLCQSHTLGSAAPATADKLCAGTCATLDSAAASSQPEL